MRELAVRFALSIGLALAAGCAPPAELAEPDEGTRAIWITRWDWRTEADLREMVERCAAAGFDTLLFQVRGNATVFYPSQIEPWAEELGGRDPGFDPLELAVRLAHERGLAIQAWANVVPAWRGLEPPSDPDHVYHAHPEWFWYDRHGQRQALCEDFYVSLNPCLPEVREYLVDVLVELVRGHPELDGVHLDYLRFPNEPPAIPVGSAADPPRDARTLALFRGATGLAPEEDPRAWDAWRSEQVTRLLRDIRAAVRREAPGLELSAAVGSVPELALRHFQDVEAWIEEGLLDRVFPMNYTADPEAFAERLAAWSDRGCELVMGIMATSGDPGLRAEQVRAAWGEVGSIAVFAYYGLYDSSNRILAGQDREASRERARRRRALLPALADCVGR